MQTDEHIEYLSSQLQLIVSQEHTFGTDALLLASFSAPKRREKAVDLGTGCGIIPFYWIREGLEEKCFGVDIQERAIDQLKRSVELNGLEQRLSPVLCDLRAMSGHFPAGSFDLVTMNPPYKPLGSGIISELQNEKIARHETMCTLEDITACASRLLRFGGRLCMCLRPERLCDAVTAMREARLEPKRLRFVAQRSGCRPWLVLIEGKRGAKPHLTVMEELYIESDETEKIVGAYRKK